MGHPGGFSFGLNLRATDHERDPTLELRKSARSSVYFMGEKSVGWSQRISAFSRVFSVCSAFATS